MEYLVNLSAPAQQVVRLLCSCQHFGGGGEEHTKTNDKTHVAPVESAGEPYVKGSCRYI
jgi:hypothetical protein